MEDNILITICARGGSKGVKDKNIQLLGDYPLIYYSFWHAFEFMRRSDSNVTIALSTDSSKIEDVVKTFDFDFDMSYSRPKKLGEDQIGKVQVINDVREFYENKNSIKYDYVIDLDVSSPLRSVNDVFVGLSLISKNKDAFNLFSVNEAYKNPYFNMVEENDSGYFELSKKGKFLTRQSSPNVYELNGSFYIYRALFFDKKITSATTSKSLIYKMDHICFDVDSEIDLTFMNYLIDKNLLDFKLLS